MLPHMTAEMSMGQALYELIKSDRLWNRHARSAMADVLVDHHTKRIPRHFRLGAAGRYGYHPRREQTKKKKYWYWHKPRDLDWVRSGRSSRSLIQRRQLRFGGAMGGPNNPGTLQGRLVMRLPYPLRRGNNTGGITPEQLKAEVTSTTSGERREIAESYRDKLVQRINTAHGGMRPYRRGGLF